MDVENQSKEKLIEELNLLKREITQLKANKAAFESQRKLLDNLVEMARYSAGKAPLKKDNLLENWMAISGSYEEEGLLIESLQNVLDISVNLTNAEKGSLFLLDSNKVVTHSILTRGQVTPGERQHLIGEILDKGLAGWVARHCEIALISDTEMDERWLNLPNQPYTVRSALSVPILRGEELLGIITLLHSQQDYFSNETAELMEISVNQIALVLEMAGRKIEKVAFEVQNKLLEKLLETLQTSAGEGLMQSSLQTALDIAVEQTGSEQGSLFLLDHSGRVFDAILSRANLTVEQRNRLIGNVLDKGLAGWVIRNKKLGLIKDTEEDERWLDLPNQPYTVRSALSVPILRSGEVLGIITLLHSQKGYFSNQTANLMKITADQLALSLENVLLYAKLEEYSQALNDELEKGRQIQIDFLPYEIIQPTNWEIAACFHPAKQVAGDFYDTFWLPNDNVNVGLVIADVCDKGVGAALFMALMRSLIRIFSTQAKLQGRRTSVILEENKPTPKGWLGQSMLTNLSHLEALQAVSLTNNYIAQNHWQMSMFATMFFGVLDSETGLISYINGGHEPLFIVNKSGIRKTIQPTGPAVGMMPDMKFKIQQIQLEPGDILIGYTDGVTEGKNPDGALFTNKRLKSLLEHPAVSASDLLEQIESNLFSYIDDAPQFDDITMLAVQRLSLFENK